jgi:hypothetical protein
LITDLSDDLVEHIMDPMIGSGQLRGVEEGGNENVADILK